MPHIVAIARGPSVVPALRSSLRDAGFSVYTPIYRERRVVRGTVRWVTELLLGAYVLVRCDGGESWMQIPSMKQCLGYIASVGDALRPALVPDCDVDAIRRREDRAGFVQDAARERFAAGQRVRAQAGVFCGCVGTYAGTTKGLRDVALLSLFGRDDVRIEFAPGVLRAA